ncbi:MAG: hypothetical protein IPJ28_01910 [Betaproteobacteria bacterium]|nr:hypothetical protein [Betaproteobacteria bacterium]
MSEDLASLLTRQLAASEAQLSTIDFVEARQLLQSHGSVILDFDYRTSQDPDFVLQVEFQPIQELQDDAGPLIEVALIARCKGEELSKTLLVRPC